MQVKNLTAGHFLELEARFGVREKIHVVLLYSGEGPPRSLLEIAKAKNVSDGFWSFVDGLGLEEADQCAGEEDGWFRGDETAVHGRFVVKRMR
jgi:hypothetical protein